MFFLDLGYRLSHLTTEEYLNIVSTMKHDFEDEFKCNDSKKYEKFKDPLRRKKIHHEISFCKGRIAPNRPSYRHIYKDISYLTCPCTFHNSEVYTLLELESNYNKFGNIPSYIYKENNLLNAPAKLIQAFRTIREFITLKEIEAQKKAEKEAKQKTR